MQSRGWAQVQVLSETEFQREAQAAFSSVFRSDDPFDEPFRPSVSRRGLLYPFGPSLQLPELQAMCISIEALGEQGFFLSVTERPPEERWGEYPFDWHWWIPVAEAEAYSRLRFPAVLQNAMYSEHGLWGILCSNEQHALVGGSVSFVDTLYSHLPLSESQQIRDFLDLWRYSRDVYGPQYGTDVRWVGRQLAHLYGSAEAQRLLREGGLAD